MEQNITSVTVVGIEAKWIPDLDDKGIVVQSNIAIRDKSDGEGLRSKCVQK
jgi:hypothetical protein